MNLIETAKKSMVLFSIVTGLIFLPQSATANEEDRISLDFEPGEYSFPYLDVIDSPLTKDDLIKLGYCHRMNALMTFHKAARKTLSLPENIDTLNVREAFLFAIRNTHGSFSHTKAPEITLMRLQEYGLLSNYIFNDIHILLQIAKFNDDMATIFENIQ